MKHPIRRRLMYLSFQGLRACVQLLPLPAARAVGRFLGFLAYGLLRGQRQLTKAHLAYAFGDSLAPAQRARIARGVFRNLGQSAMEWLLLPKLSLDTVKQLITCEGLEHLRHALAKGDGVILVSPHFGSWEFVPLYLKSVGCEGAILARRLRYAEYESFLISMRGEKGVTTLARGSLKDVAKLLRANQMVGMLPDQDMDSLEGIFINFFGHPAYTPVGPAALSLMTGAPIVPCFMIRDQARFRFVIEPPLSAPSGVDRAQAMTQLTQAWSDAMESKIRQYPDHWVWMHRRWKTQPNAAHSTQHTAHSVNPARLQPMERCARQQPAPSVLLSALCLVLFATVDGCAKSADKPTQDTKTARAAPAEPAATQHMDGFTLTGYEDTGAKRWELNGTGAHLDGNIVTIHHPDGIGYDPLHKAYLTASLGQVNQTDRHVRLEHDVTIHTTDGLWFTSPLLYWIPDDNEVTTDQSVRIETDHMLLRGRGASGFTQLKEMTIERDIELVLNPSDHDAPHDGPKQVTITCDGPLSFDYGNSVATFEKNVHVQDPNGDLYSDKLVAYLDQTTHTIRYAEATGRVRIHQQQNTALSERAVYEPSVGKITLVGKPSLLLYPSTKSQSDPLSLSGLMKTPKAAKSPQAAVPPSDAVATP
ncbi:MAG: LPS export ABC transporter periplasmic protein LptC [Candidatus Omnitrophica bacterium]|nr:LPS export ABC transporter periplasmic protein LptC [Candidatus Omnitrophota bacterium]